MLRKAVNIILAVIFLVATIGINISMHYCGGEFVSASIVQAEDTCCDGMAGCCENKTIHIEVSEKYVKATQFENVKFAVQDLLFPLLIVSNVELLGEASLSNLHLLGAAPPPTIQTILSLLQTYLI